ncbi:prolow-density lipoprotein receptor-related protein 1-like protein, partial [Dinothrombium tinctorium]
MCLPASLLGFGCAIDKQCTLKVPNSECVDGTCRCGADFIPIRRDKCLPPAKLDDYCLNNDMCTMAGKYTYCKYIIPRIYGKCKCPKGYVVTKDNQCLPSLGSKCFSDRDCEAVTPNSVCQSPSLRLSDGGSVCSCKKGFEASKNQTACEAKKANIFDILTPDASDNLTNVAAVSLGKPCNSSLQCRVRDPFSACIDGICECIEKTSECSSLNRGCYNDTFQCRNGKCISWYFVCDKVANCEDGSDEEQCGKKFHCPEEAFQCNDGTCLSRASMCNGRWECPDGSDEAQCY